jgi:dienelactone hydrolase
VTGLLAPTVAAQQFNIQPSTTVLVGEPLQIELTGWPAHAWVSVRAQRVVEDQGRKALYASQAMFKADAQGRINLATQAPGEAGADRATSSYSGADVRGLFWSMLPVPGAGAPPATADTHRVTLTASLQGTVQPAGRLPIPPVTPATPITTITTITPITPIVQTLDLLPAGPDVQSRAAPPFDGARFAYLPAPAAFAKRPVLILLGGSEGGAAVTQSAAAWASRGYAVLALPYYSPPTWDATGPGPAELPNLPIAFADIAIDRLEQARDWLAQQPEVDATRIGVMGTSKGAEFALLAGTQMPWIKSIVAVVPSDVVWEGWGPGVEPGQRAGFSWHGKPCDFVPYKDFAQEMAGFASGADVKIRRPQDQGRAAHPDRAIAARIRVEDIAAPVLVVGGDDDQLWDSGGMAKNILAVRQRAGLDTVALVYPDAGHFLGGAGMDPTTQYNASPMKAGGTPAANARAQAEAFAQTVAFLRRTLGPTPP